MLDEGPDVEPTVPGKSAPCTPCKAAEGWAGRAVGRAPASFGEHPADVQARLLEANAIPLRHDPAFAYGLIAQE
eukprot:2762021-Pyramimonas_sp.AAC.1